MRLSPRTKLLVAVALVASLGTVLWWAANPERDEGATGTFAIQVIGPDGLIFNGTAETTQATALKVLLAADAAVGLDVEVDEYTSFDGCGSYVRSIAGHAAQGAAGWIYEVRGPGEPDWRRPSQSASCQPLPSGTAVRWLWVDHE